LRPVVELLDLSEADDEAEDAQQVDDGVGDLGQVFNDILTGWKKTINLLTKFTQPFLFARDCIHNTSISS
jgi:hypothetical protein